MAMLKSLRLKNVYGYQDAYFDFTSEDDITKLALFFGQNGSGKTSVLEVVRMLAAPWRYIGRDMTMFCRKMSFHRDYDPNYFNFKPFQGIMRAEATFATGDGDKKVILESDSEKVILIDEKMNLVNKGKIEYEDVLDLLSEVGIVYNELERREIEFEGGIYTPMDYIFFPEADNPMNTTSFQLHSECADDFIDIAKAVYGYDCWLTNEVEEYDKQRKKKVKFFTDLIIYKDFDEAKVHYRRMSAGERKIATLLRLLLHPIHRALYDIYLIDEIEAHVYYTRHVTMLQKLREHFPEKQILATSHSGELIRYLQDSSPESLFDVVAIKKGR